MCLRRREPKAASVLDEGVFFMQGRGRCDVELNRDAVGPPLQDFFCLAIFHR